MTEPEETPHRLQHRLYGDYLKLSLERRRQIAKAIQHPEGYQGDDESVKSYLKSVIFPIEGIEEKARLIELIAMDIACQPPEDFT
jgi:hypothetical protein